MKPYPYRYIQEMKNVRDGEKILLIIGKSPPARGIAETASAMVTAIGRTSKKAMIYAAIIPQSP
jgi:hypothetical protein